MRILVFHGYLLHGTGSNVYNARLAEALVRAGHEVHLLCQDRDPLSLGGVDAAGGWGGGGRGGGSTRRATGTVASCASRSGGRPCGARSTGRISAACCRSTSPTATRA